LSAAERSRLASGPQILAFAAVFAALLALVFPTDKEFAQLASLPTADAYSVAYLQALTRANRDDAHLRIAYVKELAMLGRYDQALVAVAPAIANNDTAEVAKNLRFDLLLARARSLPPDGEERARAFEDVARELPEITGLQQPWARLEMLARTALALERPGLAATVLMRLAEMAPKAERAAHLAEAGRWFRAAGDGKRAALAYTRAANAEADDARAREDALAAIATLEADDLPCDAGSQASGYVGRWPQDAQILRRAVALASACGRTTEARDLGRALLALVGDDDDDELFAQVRRELHARDPRTALVLVQKLVHRHPGDANLRELEGHVAEWAGRPELALDDWLYLLGHPAQASGRFRLR
jgi:hypothetical protein